MAEVKTVNDQLSGYYLNANDERLNAINNRAKIIYRDIRSKLRTVDRIWNGCTTQGPCEVHWLSMAKSENWRLVPLVNGVIMWKPW